MRRAYRIASTVALAVAFFAVTRLAQTPLLQALEHRALDHLVVDRYQLYGTRPIDSRIILVELDEALFRQLKKPTVLWYQEMATLLAGLRDAGAVVGFDLMLKHNLEALKSDTELDNFRNRVEEGRTALAAAMLGGNIVLGEDFDDYRAGQVFDQLSSSAYAVPFPIEGEPTRHNLSAVNVATDEDGVVRSLPLVFWEDGGPKSFFARLAELVTGEPLQRGPEGVTLGTRGVPCHGPEKQLLYINYVGPGRVSYPTVSAARLLRLLAAGDTLETYAGKVCLVAPNDDSFQDDHNSPFLLLDYNSIMKGVETHATGLNSLLLGDYLERASQRAHYLLWLAAAGLGVLLGALTSPLFAVLALLGSCVGYWTLAIKMLSHNLWVPTVSVMLMLLLSWVLTFTIRYLLIDRDRKKTQMLFGRMVSDQVMKAVLSSPAARRLGGIRREVTVLFSDINDFTPQCEANMPEDVIQMLNSYFREMIEIIYANEGNLKQFVGDEIMAIFGAPMPYSDHAARAVRTAVDMQIRLEQLRKADPLGSKGGFYDVKIGIHSGRVVVGQVGSDRRSEYAAVGDDVNLGARIMGLTKSLGVKTLVSEVTYEQCKHLLPDLEFRNLGPQTFKGKSKEMVVYEVVRKGSLAPVQDNKEPGNSDKELPGGGET